MDYNLDELPPRVTAAHATAARWFTLAALMAIGAWTLWSTASESPSGVSRQPLVLYFATEHRSHHSARLSLAYNASTDDNASLTFTGLLSDKVRIAYGGGQLANCVVPEGGPTLRRSGDEYYISDAPVAITKSKLANLSTFTMPSEIPDPGVYGSVRCDVNVIPVHESMAERSFTIYYASFGADLWLRTGEELPASVSMSATVPNAERLSMRGLVTDPSRSDFVRVLTPGETVTAYWTIRELGQRRDMMLVVIGALAAAITSIVIEGVRPLITFPRRRRRASGCKRSIRDIAR